MCSSDLRRALREIVRANLGQDHLLRGQIGHPEYHFDSNAFVQSWDYVGRQRGLIRPALEAGKARPAWRAFGRLVHALQDFYAHSNYVRLWLSRYPDGARPPAEAIEPVEAGILENPELRSGIVYMPLELFAWVPGLAALVLPLLPRDAHARLNLDSPRRGWEFAYVFSAALQSTRLELRRVERDLSPDLLALFRDRSSGGEVRNDDRLSLPEV